jgi:Arc/MetJ family transcription regulator
LPKLLERPTLITFGLPAFIYTVVEIANQNLSHCGLSKHVPGLGAICCKSDMNKLASNAWRRLISRHQNLCVLMMRTTLTLDDDVAAALERLRRSRRIGLKQLVNEALRRGLSDMGKRHGPREPVRTRAVALGRVRIASIDNIGEALAIVEGESFK